MKNIFCGISILLIMTCYFSCSPRLSEKRIKLELQKFYAVNENNDVEARLYYYPIEAWKIIDKEVLANQMKGLNKDDKMGSRHEGITELEVQDRIKCGKRYLYYCSYYVNEINSSKYVDEVILQNNYLTYGKENVKLDSINNEIIVKKEESVLMIYEKQTESWKIILGNFDDLDVLDKYYGTDFGNCVKKAIEDYE